MTPTPRGTLALAASLAGLSRTELRALLARRQVSAPRSVNDPLGLAVELLRPDSLHLALQALDRAEIAALIGLEAGDSGEQDRTVLDALRRLGLVGIEAGSASSVALPETSDVLRQLLRETHAADAAASDGGTAPEPASGPAAPGAEEPARRADTSTWFGPALTAVSRTAALIRALAQRPARLSRRGTVTVTAQRELAAATHDDAARTARLLRVLRTAGLAEPFTGQGGLQLLAPSRAAEAWLALPHPERWEALAGALAHDISPELRRTVDLSPELRLAAGPLLIEEFPLLSPAARAAAQEWAESAELLGLAVEGRLAPPAASVLAGDRTSALDQATRDFPSPAEGVYLQPDLSLIVPGPLAPHDEAALAAIADTEQLGAATALRLSPASLTRALRAGRSAEAIREVLARLSLTGVPQPLDYLLGDLERKQQAGELRESKPAWLERWEAAHPDPEPAESDAGDPGAQEGAASEEGRTAELDRLAERVHAAAQQPSGAGDLTRQLELAIRERSAVRVTAVGGAEERTFTLLPVSLTAGRLRATDQTAGVERTLPVSAIVAVEAA